MSKTTLDTDYLIIGAGAAGMGFADVMVSETQARLVIVDQHGKPGGHWNDAYPFVRLHHPSHYYGAPSQRLGDLSVQREGFNTGLLHMASAPEILSHYQHVMDNHLLPSGRVQYFPMSRYDGNGVITSLVTGAQHNVSVAKRTVDATISGTTVPSTHTRAYAVAPGVACMPLNDLPRLTAPPAGYTVIGSGKTGMDACLWLLEQGVAPDCIRWIMPRDAWWFDRANAQFTPEFFQATVTGIAAQMEAVAAAGSLDDLFARLEACGALLRLDPAVTPSMFHGATINRAELEQLRRIRDVVRLGRVKRIDSDKIVLDRGEVPAKAGWLYVDCSAAGFATRPVVPVFNGATITLQMLKSFQPTFSAALIAHIEGAYDDDVQKNALCTPVAPPKHAHDWLTVMATSMANQNAWSQHPDLMAWILKCRLDPMTALMRSVSPAETEKMVLLQRSRQSIRPAVANMPKLLAELRRA
jgi:hypothetical protein